MKTKIAPSYVLAETSYAVGTPAASLKRVLGGLTAVAVVVSLLLAVAAPARAGGRDDNLAKALVAALILGAILHNSNRYDDPAPLPAPVHKPRVPRVCAIEIPGGHGYAGAVVYPERCLRREGFHHALPGCGREVRIYGRYQRAYSERCLLDAGFRIGGGRRY